MFSCSMKLLKINNHLVIRKNANKSELMPKEISKMIFTKRYFQSVTIN